MTKSQRKSAAALQPAEKSAELDWKPLNRSRTQLIAASVLLAIWIGFLVAMAIYSQYH